MKLRVTMLVIACSTFAGCGSPEVRRMRGGGPGADVGNRSLTVEMHDGSQPFWKTPDRIGVEHPSLEPARHAERSRK